MHDVILGNHKNPILTRTRIATNIPSAHICAYSVYILRMKIFSHIYPSHDMLICVTSPLCFVLRGVVPTCTIFKTTAPAPVAPLHKHHECIFRFKPHYFFRPFGSLSLSACFLVTFKIQERREKTAMMAKVKKGTISHRL